MSGPSAKEAFDNVCNPDPDAIIWPEFSVVPLPWTVGITVEPSASVQISFPADHLPLQLAPLALFPPKHCSAKIKLFKFVEKLPSLPE